MSYNTKNYTEQGGDVTVIGGTLELSSISNFDMALMFCVAYTYEHREDCDYKSLNLTLRALLYADREARF